MTFFVHNVVYRLGDDRRVVPPTEPREFPGSPAEYARTALLEWLDRHPELAGNRVIVNVWDAGRPGAGVPGDILVRLSNAQLDRGPFDESQLHVRSAYYHLLSPGYALFDDDAVLGFDGVDFVSGAPYGLIVPGEGPALRIRAGHEHGWISLHVALAETEPPADLTGWDAVEQVSLTPAGEVRVTDDDGRIQPHYPDLTGGRSLPHLTVRVSARGRDLPAPPPGATGARRTPAEYHLVEAWPATAATPRQVLRRDRTSLAFENQ